MVQALGRRPLTAETRVRSQAVHVGLMVDKIAVGQVFRRTLRFSTVTIIPILHTSSSCQHCSYQGKGGSLGTFPKAAYR
jgi:hypothetical protein